MIARANSRLVRFAVFVATIYFIASAPASAAGDSITTVAVARPISVDLLEAADWLPDRSDSLTIDDVAFGVERNAFHHAETIPNYNRLTMWLRIRPDPNWSGALIVAAPTYDSVEAYYKSGGTFRSIRVEMSTPVSLRAEKDSSLRIRIPPQASMSPYLWIRTFGDGDPIQIYSEAEADEAKFWAYAIPFAFASFTIAIAITAIFFFLYLRERQYLTWAAATALLAFYDVAQSGATWEFMWPDASISYTPTVDGIFAIYTFSMIVFSIDFLGLGVMWRNGLVATFAAMMLLHLGISSYAPSASYFLVDGQEGLPILLIYLGLLAAGLSTLLRGRITARFFVIGIILFLGFETVNALVNGSVIDDSGPLHFFDWGFELGGALNSIALQIALADAMLTIRKERLFAQERESKVRFQLIQEQDAQIRTLNTYNEAFSRFVPREFLAQLQRPDIAMVQLGDHVEREMTVLFSDIRAFTAMSEQLSPEAVFEFLNDYLAHAGPIVRNHGGFIDKFLGDAIMALFSGPVDGAVSAAISLQREVRRFNEERARASHAPMRIGVGLHCGKMILGTIGEKERFDTTVIAEAVNVAARIEEFTKVYRALIIVSGAVIENLEDPEHFHFRRLSKVTPRGAFTSVDLYEVFDADEPNALLNKISSLAEFTTAVSNLDAGAYRAAALSFEQIAADNPADDVASALLARARLLEAGVDEGA